MKKMMILLTILLTGVVSKVNAQGIQFWKGSIEEAMQEAKKQNKLVFIDFYTVWCGPCKSLAQTVFTREDVGTYFNKTFICCQLDAEKEGKAMAQKYGVNSYPTLLFINGNGDLIVRASGALPAEDLIKRGEEAVTSVDDPNNVSNLKKRYAAGERGEQFLKFYIAKMKENDMDPGNATEEYLKVQKSMEESSSKMMEFFMEYPDAFTVGGEAERIFKENEKEYMAIATDMEENKLKQIYARMMRRTQGLALKNKDVAMYELFIDRWLKLPEKPHYQDYNDLRLDLMLMRGETKAYQKEAMHYLDSIVDSRSVEQIKEEDEERYQEYCKTHPAIGFIQIAMRDSYKNLDAKLQVRAIQKVGSQLIKNGLKKKDFKRYPKWIEHGKQLMPDNVEMLNFEANVLYRQGKRDEAIELKRKVVDMVKNNAKAYPTLKAQLDKMEAGTF